MFPGSKGVYAYSADAFLTNQDRYILGKCDKVVQDLHKTDYKTIAQQQAEQAQKLAAEESKEEHDDGNNSNPSPITHINSSPETSSSNIQQLVSQIQGHVPEGLQDLNIDQMLDTLTVMSQPSSSNAQNNNELRVELDALRSTLQEYQDASTQDKVDLKKQVEWLKYVIEKHDQLLESLENTFEQDTPELQAYYNGFASTFSGAFISAQAVLAGQLKMVGNSNIKLKVALPLIKFIPVIGGEVATAMQTSADKQLELRVNDCSTNIKKFGVTVTKFEKWSKYIAHSIIQKKWNV